VVPIRIASASNSRDDNQENLIAYFAENAMDSNADAAGILVGSTRAGWGYQDKGHAGIVVRGACWRCCGALEEA
jgi:hypothetical protein